MSMNTFGKRLTAAMKNAKKSQTDIARDLSVAQASVHAWVWDKNWPTMKNILALESHLGVSAHWLLVGEEGMRNKFDYYPTPATIICELGRRIGWEPCSFWEPCNGGGHLSDGMKSFGFSAIRTDIQDGEDFFSYDEALHENLITNPPFRQIREFIDHAFAIGVKRMALVCPERLLACRKGNEQFRRHRPDVFAMMDWREDYLNKGGKPDRALAVSIWNSPCADSCDFDIWSRTL